MSAYSLDLSLSLEQSPTPNFGSIFSEKPMGARSGDFGIWICIEILLKVFDPKSEKG